MALTLDPDTGLPTGPTRIPRAGQLSPDGVTLTASPDAGSAGSSPASGTQAQSAAGGSSSSSSTTPSVTDLISLINNDPLYKQAQSDAAAGSVQDAAQLAAARARALINYGDIPDFSGQEGLVGNVGGDITDTIRQLAQQNTAAGLSTVGRLNQAYQDNLRALQQSLAARGILSSGETGYQLGKQNTTYQQGKYDALQNLLDELSGYQSSYLTNEANIRAQLAAAAQAAAGRIPTDTTAPPGGGSTDDGSGDGSSLYWLLGGDGTPRTTTPITRPGVIYAS